MSVYLVMINALYKQEIIIRVLNLLYNRKIEKNNAIVNVNVSSVCVCVCE